MCIAIYKPEKVRLTDQTLQNCWDSNPDGAGFMYVKSKKLIVKKGFMTYEAFRKAYDPVEKLQTVLHFRIKTHGSVSEDNTHPFLIDNNLAVVHNGIISKISCDTNKNLSDTYHFTEQILIPLRKKYPDFWQDTYMQTLINDYIGYSKLILMDNYNNVEIINEAAGNWNSDCWFSNHSYENAKYTPPISKWNRSWQAKQEQQKTDLFHFDAKVGDYACLTVATYVDTPDYQNEMIPKNAKIKINYFSTHNRVGIIYPISGKTALVEFWKLDEWKEPTFLRLPTKTHTIMKPWDEEDTIEDDIFKTNEEVILFKNFNHFRIGDKAIISRVTPHFVIVKETLTSTKEHGVLKTCVELVSTFMKREMEGQTCH